MLVPRDSELTLSYTHRSVWVKALTADRIIGLKKHKGHLGTASVMTADPKKRERISELLAAAGVVRITSAGNMCRAAAGGAHDGTYPLREYSRIVETEISD